MSQSINTVTVSGNLTTDPRATDKDVVVFTVAHTRSWKDDTKWRRRTSYVPGIAFKSHLKEALLTRGRTGSAVVVEGRLETFESEGSDHHDRFQLVAQNIVFGERSNPRSASS